MSLRRVCTEAARSPLSVSGGSVSAPSHVMRSVEALPLVNALIGLPQVIAVEARARGGSPPNAAWASHYRPQRAQSVRSGHLPAFETAGSEPTSDLLLHEDVVARVSEQPHGKRLEAGL